MCSVAATDGYRKGEGAGQETGGLRGIHSGTGGKTLDKRKSKGGKQPQNLARGLKMAIRDVIEPPLLPNRIQSQQEATNNLRMIAAYFLCQEITTCSKLMALSHHFEALGRIYIETQMYYH